MCALPPQAAEVAASAQQARLATAAAAQQTQGEELQRAVRQAGYAHAEQVAALELRHAKEMEKAVEAAFARGAAEAREAARLEADVARVTAREGVKREVRAAETAAVRKAEAVLERVMAAQRAEQEAAVQKGIRDYEAQLLMSPVRAAKR